ATGVRINPVEVNPDFVAPTIPKVEWVVLLEAANTLHLVEVNVLEGTLQCPESGRLFPISCGIPNMLLSDEETET
ncbi:hypothetical protein EI555_008181, partial [Monodon monoceros]